MWASERNMCPSLHDFAELQLNTVKVNTSHIVKMSWCNSSSCQKLWKLSCKSAKRRSASPVRGVSARTTHSLMSTRSFKSWATHHKTTGFQHIYSLFALFSSCRSCVSFDGCNISDSPFTPLLVFSLTQIPHHSLLFFISYSIAPFPGILAHGRTAFVSKF